MRRRRAQRAESARAKYASEQAAVPEVRRKTAALKRTVRRLKSLDRRDKRLGIARDWRPIFAGLGYPKGVPGLSRALRI